MENRELDVSTLIPAQLINVSRKKKKQSYFVWQHLNEVLCIYSCIYSKTWSKVNLDCFMDKRNRQPAGIFFIMFK